jgi:hypothetical protein
MGRLFFDSLSKKIDEWKKDNLLFTYQFLYEEKDSTKYLILIQRQTKFKLCISLSYSKQSLELTSFRINSSDFLKNISISLHETALLELVAQGLSLSIFTAQTLKSDDITFLLSRDDAYNLELVNDLFDYSSLNFKFDVIPEQLTFSVWAPNLCEFHESIEKLKNQIQQYLCWIQKNDSVIQRYFDASAKDNNGILRNMRGAQFKYH